MEFVGECCVRARQTAGDSQGVHEFSGVRATAAQIAPEGGEEFAIKLDDKTFDTGSVVAGELMVCTSNVELRLVGRTPAEQDVVKEIRARAKAARKLVKSRRKKHSSSATQGHTPSVMSPARSPALAVRSGSPAHGALRNTIFGGKRGRGRALVAAVADQQHDFSGAAPSPAPAPAPSPAPPAHHKTKPIQATLRTPPRNAARRRSSLTPGAVTTIQYETKKKPRTALGGITDGELASRSSVVRKARSFRVTAASQQQPTLWESFAAAAHTHTHAAAPPQGRGGLANLGNTCYLNAVLQALVSLPGFVHDLSAPAWGDMAGRAAPFLTALLRVLRDVRRGRAAVNAAAVKSALTVSELFANNRQQDAHEFLVAALHQLESEMLPVLPAVSAAVHADVALDENGQPSKDCGGCAVPSIRHFLTDLAVELTCAGCGHRRVVCDSDAGVSLALPPAPAAAGGGEAGGECAHGPLVRLVAGPQAKNPGRAYWRCPQPQRDERCDNAFRWARPEPPQPARPALALPQLLDDHFAPETLELRCEECQHGAATAQRRFATLPRTLVVHLQRFELAPHAREYLKRQDEVRPAAELDVGPWLAEDARLAPAGCAPGPPEAPQGEEESPAKRPRVAPESEAGGGGGGGGPRQCGACTFVELDAARSRCSMCGGDLPGGSAPPPRQCGSCTLINRNAAAKRCSACNSPLPPVSAVSAAAAAAPADPGAVPTAIPRPTRAGRYRLRSVVHHIGPSAFVGHYVTDVRADDGTWRRFNDAAVECVPAEWALGASSSAYMMMYEAV